jgi:hypothetical protein
MEFKHNNSGDLSYKETRLKTDVMFDEDDNES